MTDAPPPAAALDQLIAGDPGRDIRELGLIAQDGNSAAWSGRPHGALILYLLARQEPRGMRIDRLMLASLSYILLVRRGAALPLA